MFYIYGVSGQSFRGSMEQLRQIERPGAVSRSSRLKPIKRDGLDPAPVTLLPGATPLAPADEASRSALTAYAQAQNPVVPRQPLRQVQDVMSSTVITISDAASVLQAWHLLARHGVGQAPVVNRAGALVGLLCRADLLSLDLLPTPDSGALAWHALMMQNVGDIMSTPVPSVAPQADIRRVARVLLDTGLPGLAVVDEQGLVIGFIARSDILRAVVADPPLDLWG